MPHQEHGTDEGCRHQREGRKHGRPRDHDPEPGGGAVLGRHVDRPADPGEHEKSKNRPGDRDAGVGAGALQHTGNSGALPDAAAAVAIDLRGGRGGTRGVRVRGIGARSRGGIGGSAEEVGNAPPCLPGRAADAVLDPARSSGCAVARSAPGAGAAVANLGRRSVRTGADLGQRVHAWQATANGPCSSPDRRPETIPGDCREKVARLVSGRQAASDPWLYWLLAVPPTEPEVKSIVGKPGADTDRAPGESASL